MRKNMQCVYQKCCDPQHQVSDVIGVGEIPRCHHLTDPNWKVQTAQDPGEDLHTKRHILYSLEFQLTHTVQQSLIKYINRRAYAHMSAHDSLWEYKGSSPHSRCYRWRGEQTG